MGLGEVQVKSRGSKWSRYQAMAEFWAGAPCLLWVKQLFGAWCVVLVTASHGGAAPPLPTAIKRDLRVIYQCFSMAWCAHDEPWRFWAPGVSTWCPTIAITEGLTG